MQILGLARDALDRAFVVALGRATEHVGHELLREAAHGRVGSGDRRGQLRAAVDGKLTKESTSLEAGRLGTLQVVNGSEILLGAPFIYNKENIDSFDF